MPSLYFKMSPQPCTAETSLTTSVREREGEREGGIERERGREREREGKIEREREGEREREMG